MKENYSNDELASCQFCGGGLEEDGICENFLCPDYVAPNPQSVIYDHFRGVTELINKQEGGE